MRFNAKAVAGKEERGFPGMIMASSSLRKAKPTRKIVARTPLDRVAEARKK